MPQKGEKRALLDLARRDVVEMTKTLEVKAATAREKEEAVRGAIAAARRNGAEGGLSRGVLRYFQYQRR